MPSEHAHLQPSSAKRWFACPGSPALAEDVPDTGGPAAAQGSACHKLLADLLRGAPPEQFVGMDLLPTADDGWDGPVHVTEEMVEWVRLAFAWVQHYVASYPGTLVRVEERVEVGAAFGCPDRLWGTADITLVRPEVLVVVDAKFGFERVEARRNPQLSLYLIGRAHEYGWKHDMYEQAIIQPPLPGIPQVEMLTRAELEDRRDTYRARVAAALQPGAPLVVNDECRYCPAAGKCPVYQAWAEQRAIEVFTEKLPVVDPKRLSEMLRQAPLIRKALDAAEDYALQRLALGEPVPGFKRVASKGHRKWRDPDDAARTLGLLADPKLLFTEPELLSPAQVEKKLKLPKHIIDNLAPAPDSSPKLVPEDDDRPALAPAFKPVLEE